MTPAQAEADRWRGHPVLGALVRVLVVLVPIAASLGVSVLLMRLLPESTSALGTVAWWVVVLAVSWAVALGVDRIARRALPLAVLLELSLVFPDRAPSRLRTVRAMTTRELDRQLTILRTAGERGTPLEVAETLVILVGVLGLHDPRTRGHSERVRAYVDLISEELHLPEADRVRLRWAALIHDLGKLTVPASVLNGNANLPPEAWVQLHAHPDEGERLAAGLLPWLGEWGSAVRQHHEWWSGRGYPQGLAGENISRGARIIGVADAFEVMTANRSYSRARSASAARAELAECAGTQFDPAVVRAFLQISIGRLRWVIGPLSWVSLLPFTANRLGDVVRAGAATAAIVGSVVGGVVVGPGGPADGGRRPELAGGPSGSASATASSTGTPSSSGGGAPGASGSAGASGTASATASGSTSASASSAGAAPTAAPTSRATTRPPTAAPSTYYLRTGTLVPARPTGEPPGSVRLLAGREGRAFNVLVRSGPTDLSEAMLVVWDRVLGPRGQDALGQLDVLLSDCRSASGPCTVLSTTVMPIGIERDANRAGYSRESAKLSGAADLPAGHVLRLTLRLRTQGTADSAIIAFGAASTPSRLELAPA